MNNCRPISHSSFFSRSTFVALAASFGVCKVDWLLFYAVDGGVHQSLFYAVDDGVHQSGPRKSFGSTFAPPTIFLMNYCWPPSLSPHFSRSAFVELAAFLGVCKVDGLLFYGPWREERNRRGRASRQLFVCDSGYRMEALRKMTQDHPYPSTFAYTIVPSCIFLPAAQPAAGLQAAFFFSFSQVQKVPKITNNLKNCYDTKLICLLNNVCSPLF